MQGHRRSWRTWRDRAILCLVLGGLTSAIAAWAPPSHGAVFTQRRFVTADGSLWTTEYRSRFISILHYRHNPPHSLRTAIDNGHIIRPPWLAPPSEQHHYAVAKGWPFRSLTGWVTSAAEARWMMQVGADGKGWVLPYLPVWPGCVFSGLFHAALWWAVLLAVPHTFRRIAIEPARRRRGRCARCGYDLAGLPADGAGRRTCPECATAERPRRRG